MAERNTQWRDGELIDLPVKAAVKIEVGKMVGFNSTGWAVEAADIAGIDIIGVADATADNSNGSNGDERVRVRKGKHFLLNNSSTNAVDVADAGSYVFVEDDQTVADDPGTNGVIAGRCVEVVTAGVWVEIPAIPQIAAQAATTATDVAGLVTDFNALVAKLKASGIMATA